VRLPDLFPDRLSVDLESGSKDLRVSARANRQALILTGEDLFARREEIAALIRRCVRAEPHIMWQFVLAPAAEEPLDLRPAAVRQAAARPCLRPVLDRRRRGYSRRALSLGSSLSSMVRDLSPAIQSGGKPPHSTCESVIAAKNVETSK
jgi:hypothetical protein